jgi:pyruvate-formate lyase-activating enzyme
MRDEFYREHLRLLSVAPVLRNLRTYAASTHVEIVTPIADEIMIEELEQMAEYIASIDPQIPWHLFRLFRSEKYADKRTRGLSYDESIAFVERIRTRLPFVYFVNFPGSRWADTICPDCGHILVNRITIGACGSRFVSMDIDKSNCCPICSRKIPMIL